MIELAFTIALGIILVPFLVYGIMLVVGAVLGIVAFLLAVPAYIIYAVLNPKEAFKDYVNHYKNNKSKGNSIIMYTFLVVIVCLLALLVLL